MKMPLCTWYFLDSIPVEILDEVQDEYANKVRRVLVTWREGGPIE